MKFFHQALFFLITPLVFLCLMTTKSYSKDMEAPPSIIKYFLQMTQDNNQQTDASYQFIEENWQEGFIPMILETIYLSPNPITSKRLITLLETKTQQSFGFNLDQWYVWLWQKHLKPYDDYANFKSALYQTIDPRFSKYFSSNRPSIIRLDEVRWGGVGQDGIPPLHSPKMISASDANYLEDDHIVFGIEVNGDVRAYPKRILAWHEMFVDTVGNQPVAGVYCTLCGTMVLYKTEVDGITHQIGTSGFLYRSNKLMYDKATQSLWNTIWGKPVIGPLVGKGIQLERLSVVTSTWGEWRRRHPSTQVLSLDTGFTRDYGENIAYKEYFSTDELMFIVPDLDTRLKNKDEILGLILNHAPDKPLAIASQFLKNNPIYHDEISGQRLAILTDPSGAHRVYEAKDIIFTEWNQNVTLKDNQNQEWKLSEDILESSAGQKLYRLPSHNAFWFGWYSAYKHTRLVQ